MHRMLLLLIVLFIAPLAASAQTARQQSACPGPDDLPPRLVAGEQARVLAGVTLNVRPQASVNIARIGVVRPGSSFEVLAGPACADGFVWWQIDHEDSVGWVAEGSASDSSYWIEPRGELIVQTDEDGRSRRYVRHESGLLELEGCFSPPEDYRRVEIGYARLNARTVAMLDQAQRIYESAGGQRMNFRQLITQGSYNPGGVSASFGTHDGGGAVDISVRSYEDWSVLYDEIEPMIEALRTAGFAAWLRDTGDLYPDSPIHIHAIAIGDAEASAIAQEQVDGPMGYLRGYDGLPREDGIPVPDRHGGPVLCGWMIEQGFSDMRPGATAAGEPNNNQE